MASGANLINSDGQVVGEETNATDGYHAAIWDATNGLRDLNTVFAAYLTAWSAANGNATVVLNDAQAINDKDVITRHRNHQWDCQPGVCHDPVVRRRQFRRQGRHQRPDARF